MPAAIFLHATYYAFATHASFDYTLLATTPLPIITGFRLLRFASTIAFNVISYFHTPMLILHARLRAAIIASRHIERHIAVH